MFRCEEEECREIQARCQRWKKEMSEGKRLAPYAGCYWCLVPQAWCDRWREKAGAGRAGMYEPVEGRSECEYRDIVVEIVGVLMAVEEGFQAGMEARMPAEIDIEQVTRYWGRREKWGGIDCCRIIIEIWEGLQIG